MKQQARKPPQTQTNRAFKKRPEQTSESNQHQTIKQQTCNHSCHGNKPYYVLLL